MRYNLSDFIAFTLFLSNLATVTRTEIAEVEEQFIQHGGNYPFSLSDWDAVKEWYKEDEQNKLKKFCAAAHKAAGFGECEVDTVVLDTNRLIFTNEKYKAKEVRTLTYGINGTLWYLTEGAREDCVFYLNLVDNIKMEFKLQKQICGIEALGIYIPPRIPDPMDY